MHKWSLVDMVISVNGVWNSVSVTCVSHRFDEGTNGVQSQDLIGRKTIKCGGAYIENTSKKSATLRTS